MNAVSKWYVLGTCYRTAAQKISTSSHHKPSFIPVRTVCRLRATKRKTVVSRLANTKTTTALTSACRSVFQLGGHACSMVEARRFLGAAEMAHPVHFFEIGA